MAGPANSLNITQPGIVVFDGVSNFLGRSLIQGTGVTITNGDGILGNPTISVTGGAAVNSVVTTNATPQFALSGGVETINFSLTNLILGSSLPALTSGSANVGIGPTIMGALTSGVNNTAMGNLTLQSITSGTSNVVIGFGAGRFITIGSANTLIGTSAGTSLTTGGSNTALGQGALAIYTTGAANAGSNVAIGASALPLINTGVNNIGIGTSSGNSYVSSESSNIVIGNAGIVAESNTIRIGTQGTGTAQQSQTFIAGVINTVSGRVVKITTPGAYPYLTLTTDYVILVDTSAARTINLIASPVTGTTYRIKDNVGSAAANNITITPNAGNIDGSASFTINTNWESIDIVYNGTQWNCL